MNSLNVWIFGVKYSWNVERISIGNIKQQVDKGQKFQELLDIMNNH